MMDIRIVCFSQKGEELGRRLQEGEVTRIRSGGLPDCPARREPSGQDAGEVRTRLGTWTEAGFREADALVFIGACGIAVRAVAPFLRSKLTDPAVLVVDEAGRFVISLLSGHIGGANALAHRFAQKLGACEVITTATDSRRTFAADAWAREEGLGIVNPEAVRHISSALLQGGEVVISAGEEKLRLVPKDLVLGTGCRKGTDPEHMLEAFREWCGRHGIEQAAIGGIASIDLKAEEPALLALARSLRLRPVCYSAKELGEAEGTFSSSAFVLETTGVDNVCERAAVRLSGGTLVLPKENCGGVTFALAKRPEAVSWQWEELPAEG